ncbi:MAG: hypothetical protein H7288_19480 [Kineosporiaceae bacterium]|nr:hypothetical protein [Aeromicrobium sp.]
MKRWLKRQWWQQEWPLYLLCAAITGTLTATALELWNAKLTVPLTYWGDALATADHFKTVMETGWFTYQPLLSAPYGQTYNDFPTAENLSFMAAGVFGFISRNFFVAMNLYYFFGFIAAALTALWLFRRLGISKIVSLVMATLFALAPYHFIRGESHLFLASYYIVPLSIWIVIKAIRGESLWTKPHKGSPRLRWLTSQATGTLVILLLTATAETYYAVFFLILIAFAGVVRLIRTGEWRRFWGAAIAGGVAAIALVINTLPATIYALINGQNPASLVRSRVDVEVYALKLSQLLLPWNGNRVPFLRHIRNLYDQKYPLVSESPALGAVAAIGLIALLLVVGYVVATAALPRLRSERFAERFGVLTQLAALTLVAFLFSTIGGLSTIISFLTSSLRGWNRMSIYIAVLSLAASGILLDAAIRWLQKRANKRPVLSGAIAIVVSGAVLTGGYVDQTPANPSADYPATIGAFNADATWFARVDSELPTGAKILQLPYQPFPETVSATGTQSSDVLLPFLHTTDLRWSGGGIKGRPRADWPGVIEQYSPPDLVALAAASGFSGIHIDRSALKKADAASLESGLTDALNIAPIVSANKRFVFYDLRAKCTALRARYSAAVLHRVEKSVVVPVIVDSSATFVTTTDAQERSFEQTTASISPISLTSAGTKPVHGTLSGTVRLIDAPPGVGQLTVTLPNGTIYEVRFTNGVAKISLPIVVMPGVSSLTFTFTGSTASKPIAMELHSLVVEEPVVTAFLSHNTMTPWAP